MRRSGTGWDVGRPPLHGGGQGFESPRLHLQNIVFCRNNANQREGTGAIHSRPPFLYSSEAHVKREMQVPLLPGIPPHTRHIRLYQIRWVSALSLAVLHRSEEHTSELQSRQYL